MSRVLVVDDHAVIRRGVQGILRAYPEWELCGEAENGQEAIKLAETLKPEIIIMDVSMPVLNGLEATRIIHELLPNTRILLLTLHSSTELVRALNVVAGDGTYVSPGIDGLVAQRVIVEESQRMAH